MARGDCGRQKGFTRKPVETACLVISTLFHLFASQHVLSVMAAQVGGGAATYRYDLLGALYSGVIILSTVMSCFYHMEGESGGLLYVLDYGLAGFWGLLDVMVACLHPKAPFSAWRVAVILGLNLLVAELCHVVDHMVAAKRGRQSPSEAEDEDDATPAKKAAPDVKRPFLDAYSSLHSAWHLLSASKALYVARLLFV